MNQQEAKALLDRYNSGNCTPEERAMVESWFLTLKDEGSPASPEKISKVSQEVWEAIKPATEHQVITRQFPLWRRIAVAASITLMVSIGALLYFNRHTNHNSQENVVKNDVAPGKQGATLTLANGKKIRLTEAVNGKLAQEAGVTITKSANGQLVYEIKGNAGEENIVNTLSTSNGETYQVRLPDGSAVWLNSASSLTYSANLITDGKRRVTLSGEGYFEVAKDKVHPFIVATGAQEVEVLGTHFNVNSYADEPAVATTLLEGLVKVSSPLRGREQTQILKPGFQVLNNGTNLRVQEADTEATIDWKEGDFNLEGLDFKVAMRKIARWYDVELIYDANLPDGIQTGGWISRNSKLSSILKLIEKSKQVHFKVEGRKVYVSK